VWEEVEEERKDFRVKGEEGRELMVKNI